MKEFADKAPRIEETPVETPKKLDTAAAFEKLVALQKLMEEMEEKLEADFIKSQEDEKDSKALETLEKLQAELNKLI
jgi:hypothetical protein